MPIVTIVKRPKTKIAFIIFVITLLFGFSTGFSFKLSPLSEQGRHYSLLAESFLHKKLHLLENPNPKLLALPNPYDPIQNGSYRIHDASLYNGRYYLYWGPIPAITRILFLNKLPEQFFIFLYVTGCVILYFFITKKIKNSYFPKTNRIFFYFTILSGGFNGVVLNLLASSGIYYEAISAAQFFFLTGLLITIHYLSNPKNKYIFFSAIFYTLSFASRISYILPCSVIGIFYLIKLIKSKKASIFSTLLPLSPYLIGLLLLGLYNFLRFGDLFEFGIQYQLAGIDMPKNYQKFTSIHNIPSHIQNYFLNLPTLIHHLPFISTDIKHYPNTERLVFSAFLISPITIFTFFFSKTSAKITKIKRLLSLVFFLFVISISLFSPISATRYFFDFIFIFSLLGFISLSSLNKNRKILLSLIPLSVISIFFAFTMYFKAMQESRRQSYFNVNRLFYSLTQKPNIIDKTAYDDLTLVINKTKFLIFNNAISRNATVHLYPKTVQTYTIMDQEDISLTFVSFESKTININLGYKNLEPKPIIVSRPLTIHPGINKITIQASGTPTELSNFELLE